MASKIIIAIDGYSSCGKSTLAKQLAGELGYRYIDSGAMYRAVTLYFLRNGINFQDPDQVNAALQHIHLSFEYNPDTGRSEIHLNDENVERYIRDLIIAEKVSAIAAVRAVRTFAVTQQKKMGKKKGIVMDGRDIGTVVFPGAELKIFMTADLAIRVKRRFEELCGAGQAATIEDVKHNLAMRDYIDSNREESPLRQAEDAVILDNSNITREQQLKLVLDWVNEKIAMKQVLAAK